MTSPRNGNQRICWLSPSDPPDAFPDVERALVEPDGLLAAGGNLSSERLLAAYPRGIFPWFDDGQPILWWSPDPRCVLFPAEFHVSRRLRREMRRSDAEIRFNTGFGEVIRACSEPRMTQQGTWITDDMVAAYCRLQEEGWAHSIEVWQEGVLVGGLYGIAIGRVFFGESMFSRRDNASKYALHALCRQPHFELIDCQVSSRHLDTLGARTIPRAEFTSRLRAACDPPASFADWPGAPLRVHEIAP